MRKRDTTHLSACGSEGEGAPAEAGAGRTTPLRESRQCGGEDEASEGGGALGLFHPGRGMRSWTR